MATPRLIKRLLEASSVQWCLSATVSAYVTLVRWTSRIDRPAPPPGGPFLVAMWHGRLLMLNYLRHGERPMIALISANRDGQIISKIASFFNVGSATGSSSRNASKGLRELIRFARDGHSLFITPDGPRGPRMRAQRGVIEIARLTGLPILPASASASRALIASSWDRFLLPYPFGKIAIRWGEPIHVGRDSRVDIAQIERSMTGVQQAADEACGRKPIKIAGSARRARKLKTVRGRQREV